MKVILKKTNEIKDISPGYALNYLIPQGLAVLATEEEIKRLEIEKLRESEKQQEKEKEDKALAEKLRGARIKIAVKTGKAKKLFGSVTKAKIKKALKDLKVDAGRVEVALDKPIKKTGKYKIDLKVGSKKVRIEIFVEGK